MRLSGSRSCGEPRSTKPRRHSPTPPPPSYMGLTRPALRLKPPGRRLRKARSPKICRRYEIPRAELEAGLGVLTAFVKAGLVTSNGEARRQIKGGGLRINDVAADDREDDPEDQRPHAGRRDQAVCWKKAPRPAQACIGAFAQGPFSCRQKSVPLRDHGPERRDKISRNKPAETGPGSAQCARVVFHAFGARSRSR